MLWSHIDKHFLALQLEYNLTHLRWFWLRSVIFVTKVVTCLMLECICDFGISYKLMAYFWACVIFASVSLFNVFWCNVYFYLHMSISTILKSTWLSGFICNILNRTNTRKHVLSIWIKASLYSDTKSSRAFRYPKFCKPILSPKTWVEDERACKVRDAHFGHHWDRHFPHKSGTRYGTPGDILRQLIWK